MLSEEKWYALTGRVVEAKVEADGDIHIALADATGNNLGTVSAEILVGPRWCEIRQTVFGWTTQEFPFSVKTAHALKIREPHVITVTGKAFYDIGHAPADHSNRRSTPKRLRGVIDTKENTVLCKDRQSGEAILALKPVTFRYKEELDPAGVPQFGLVAEQVEKVIHRGMPAQKVFDKGVWRWLRSH